MATYRRFTNAQILARIQKGVYKTLTDANRAVSKATNLSGSDKTACKKAALVYFGKKEKSPKAKKPVSAVRIPTRKSVGMFLHLKAKLEGNKYVSMSYFQRAVTRSEGLTAQERKSLRDMGSEIFEGKAARSLDNVTVTKKGSPDKSNKATPFAILYHKAKQSKEKAKLITTLVRSAMDANLTLDSLLEHMEA